MGGQQGSRGYLYQGIVCIFSACAENTWDNISVEYKTKDDKVDIALLSSVGTVQKAIQVKSSTNLFAQNDIKTWLTDIMNDIDSEEYQLILIGNCHEQANLLIKSIEKYCNNSMDKEAEKSLGDFDKQLSGKNVKVILLPFDENQLIGVIRDSLNRFISLKGYTIDYTTLEEISYALLSLYMFLGTKGKEMSRASYEKHLTDWLMSSANGNMKKSGIYSELKLLGFHQTDGSLSDTVFAVPFAKLESLNEIKTSILREGKEIIEKISRINLPAFTESEQTQSSVSTENVQAYLKGEIPLINMEAFSQNKKSELSDDEKQATILNIKKYWNLDITQDFFYVGNLTEKIPLLPFGGAADCNGTDIEKHKDSLIHELRWKILILDYIEYLSNMLKDVHILPLCIKNVGNTADKNISVSISTSNNSFKLFSMRSNINSEDKELLGVLADTLIEEKIIEQALNIKANSNIELEPQKFVSPPPFIMPDLFGNKRRCNFNDLVSEWELYQAEEKATGVITYELSSLRPGEAKWLSPYMIIIPGSEEFSVEYAILSDASDDKKIGVIDVRFLPE